MPSSRPSTGSAPKPTSRSGSTLVARFFDVKPRRRGGGGGGRPRRARGVRSDREPDNDAVAFRAGAIWWSGGGTKPAWTPRRHSRAAADALRGSRPRRVRCDRTDRCVRSLRADCYMRRLCVSCAGTYRRLPAGAIVERFSVTRRGSVRTSRRIASRAAGHRSGRERDAGGRHVDCERSGRQPGDYVVQ